ncbi:NADPH-dependent FMN reductase [Actinokineospora xionganensis]|uniref:NADPH-dependent FMN reductase n=1 Tax=Actinokineospora xionganensis TaxID=2684470 RepID=A0ABR7LCQ4_9PSEU|nr:NADPH-dependent FMN reductase [Actinokineospora xionganensis]MBC6450465.1 NADPH-dependent FMN reductase [Actinokineospora xionganensis]
MASVVIISGSPSASARAGILVAHAEVELRRAGHRVHTIAVRDLPTVALLSEDVDHPEIRAALDLVACADGLVVASPVYRAAYSGLVKSLLDLLPSGVLESIAVLPLANGGTQGHIVAIDFALLPLLRALGADDVLPGHFVLDRMIAAPEEGGFVRPLAAVALNETLSEFARLMAATRLPVALTG